MLYLASRSPRRRVLLRRITRTFRTVPSTFRETFRRSESARQNAIRNAQGKALAAQLPRGATCGIVIGADTFLYFQGALIGKPTTLAAAARMLRKLSGRAHWVYTGVCVRDLASGRMRCGAVRTKVTFKRLDAATLARLLARMRPLDKAGAYSLQSERGELVASIQGSRTNVIGLPLELLRKELAALTGRPKRTY